MVRGYWLVLGFIFLTGILPAANISVSTEVNSAAIGVKQAFEVYIRIVREEELNVEMDSFRLDDQPIDVSLVNTSQQSSITIVNGRRTEEHYVTETYRFYAEGRDAGAYELPSVTVRIGGRVYRSDPLSFEISEAGQSQDFRLQASVDGIQPLYPGQKVRFVYRIYSKRPFDITSEDLPLLEAKGFKRIGERNIRSFVRADTQVLEVSQEVQALKAGYFKFETSAIEAFAYQETFFGRKRYIQPRMRAEADSIFIQVHEFPSKDRPQFFSGAVGDFSLSASLLTPSEVQVGDKMELELRFRGTGEWETISLPVFTQQPGFRGNFRLSDLPPLGEMKNGDKVYVLELRPLAENITSIPSIRFSTFDPVKGAYQVMQTEAIPIRVKPGKVLEQIERQELPEQQVPVEKQHLTQEIESSSTLPSIAIYGNYPIRSEQLQKRPLVFLHMPFVLAFGLALLLLQIFLRHRGQKLVDPVQQLSSLDILRKARASSEDRLVWVERALRLRIEELGLDVANLEGVGLEGELREALELIAEQRFAGKASSSPEALMGKVEELCRREGPK